MFYILPSPPLLFLLEEGTWWSYFLAWTWWHILWYVLLFEKSYNICQGVENIKVGRNDSDFGVHKTEALVKMQAPEPCPKRFWLYRLRGTRGTALFIVMQVVLKPHFKSTELEFMVCHRARRENETREWNKTKSEWKGLRALCQEFGLLSQVRKGVYRGLLKSFVRRTRTPA